MMNDILYGLLLGIETVSIGIGAVCTFVYWVRAGNENSTTYFRYIMLLIPLAILAYETEEKARSIFGQPLATIIPAAVIAILGVITGVCIIVRELMRERK